jgi:hypothetical protein
MNATLHFPNGKIDKFVSFMTVHKTPAPHGSYTTLCDKYYIYVTTFVLSPAAANKKSGMVVSDHPTPS